MPPGAVAAVSGWGVFDLRVQFIIRTDGATVIVLLLHVSCCIRTCGQVFSGYGLFVKLEAFRSAVIALFGPAAGRCLSLSAGEQVIARHFINF